MNRQRGFAIPALLGLEKYLLMAAAVLALCAMSYVKGCSDEHERGADFRAAVAATGKAAEDAARTLKTRRDAITKAKDEEHAKRVADLAVTVTRLRDNAGRSIVPAAPQGSRRPELACFGRGELDDALRAYRQRTADLIGEGAAATLDLDTVKAWWAEIAR